MQDLMPGLYIAPNIHPILIHFPIALWAVALLFWSLAVWRDDAQLFSVGRWLLYLGTVTGILAVGSGFLAADDLGHDSPGHDFVHVHRNFVIGATIAATILSVFALRLRASTRRAVRLALVASLGLVNALTALGADRGAVDRARVDRR